MSGQIREVAPPAHRAVCTLQALGSTHLADAHLGDTLVPRLGRAAEHRRAGEVSQRTTDSSAGHTARTLMTSPTPSLNSNFWPLSREESNLEPSVSVPAKGVSN